MSDKLEAWASIHDIDTNMGPLKRLAFNEETVDKMPRVGVGEVEGYPIEASFVGDASFQKNA